MKVIYPDKINSVSADTENANYPADNVLNNVSEKAWKATATEGTLTLNMAADAEVVGFVGSNADSVTINIKTTGDVLIETYSKNLEPYKLKNFFQEYTLQSAEHKVEIVCTTDGSEPAKLGTVKAGGLKDWAHDPLYGIAESPVSYSTIKETRDKSQLIIPKRTLRKFSGQFLIQRDDEYYDIVRDYVDVVGDTINIFSIADENQVYWTVLGYLTVPPSARHSYPEYSSLSFSITEVP